MHRPRTRVCRMRCTRMWTSECRFIIMVLQGILLPKLIPVHSARAHALLLLVLGVLVVRDGRVISVVQVVISFFKFTRKRILSTRLGSGSSGGCGVRIQSGVGWEMRRRRKSRLSLFFLMNGRISGRSSRSSSGSGSRMVSISGSEKVNALLSHRLRMIIQGWLVDRLC